MAEEDEGARPERGVLDRVLGGFERFDAGDGAAHDAAEFGDGGIVVGGGLRDEAIEGEPGLGGDGAELFELAAGFVEVAAETLQVLLHELGRLGECDRADHAEHAVDDAVAEAEQGAS